MYKRLGSGEGGWRTYPRHRCSVGGNVALEWGSMGRIGDLRQSRGSGGGKWEKYGAKPSGAGSVRGEG